MKDIVEICSESERMSLDRRARIETNVFISRSFKLYFEIIWYANNCITVYEIVSHP